MNWQRKANLIVGWLVTRWRTLDKRAVNRTEKRNVLEAISPRQHLAGLISRVACRDKQAFEELYRVTARKMYAVALRIVREPSIAQDVIQDAYIRVWRYAHTFNEKLSAPETWLHQVVRNRALDLVSQQSNGHVSLDAMADVEDEESAWTQPHTDPDDPEHRLVNSCLSALEGKYRQVLTLAFNHGMSHAEIASHLGIPLGTVKTWARRGLTELKAAFDKSSGELAGGMRASRASGFARASDAGESELRRAM